MSAWAAGTASMPEASLVASSVVLAIAGGIFSTSLLLNHFSGNTWFFISLSIVRLCIHLDDIDCLVYFR
jgi:hypothetical protein